MTEEQILKIQLELSLSAAAVVETINTVKGVDPVLAGQLSKNFINYVQKNAPTDLAFSLSELEKYGYIN